MDLTTRELIVIELALINRESFLTENIGNVPGAKEKLAESRKHFETKIIHHTETPKEKQLMEIKHHRQRCTPPARIQGHPQHHPAELVASSESPTSRVSMNQFKDDRRMFTVAIPNDVADQLRQLGYNVKTTLPTDEQKADGMEEISHLKVMVDDNSMVAMGPAGSTPSIISTANFGIVDMTRYEEWDCELRAWNYNKDDVDEGAREGRVVEPLYSARLVQFIGTMRPNILAEKYGAIQ